MKPSLFSRLKSALRTAFSTPAAVPSPVSAPNSQVAAAPSNPLNEPVPEKDVIQRYELAPSTRRIIVVCGSCGVRHELDAVCALCGTPLCKDERNCRHQKMDMNLGKTIIVCQNCK